MGIISIYPFISIVTDERVLLDNPQYSLIYRFFNEPAIDKVILYTACALTIFFLARTILSFCLLYYKNTSFYLDSTEIYLIDYINIICTLIMKAISKAMLQA